MNNFAMWIGYALMGWLAVLFVAGMLGLAIGHLWRALKRLQTWRFVSQAMREWAENHPEEAARIREREQ